MQLLLLRHGIAEDQAPDGLDASRQLTDKGIRKTTDVARGLARFTDAPNVILTSPKVRAVQTANIVASVFDLVPRPVDQLARGDLDALCALIDELPHAVVMLVGHEPTFSRLIERLCTGSAGDFIQLKKAGCACLDYHPPARAVLQWLATPRMLAAITPEAPPGQ